MNPQEQWWTSLEGDKYTQRNSRAGEERMKMWREILGALPHQPVSILEVGANIGLNLDALRALLPEAGLIGLEPNETARQQIHFEALDGTAQDIPLPPASVDMVFSCGVLIHVPPNELGAACDEIHRVASKYIVCIEYFADQPEEVRYRGQDGLLWKRDFGRFYLERFPNLRVLDYGFFWRPATGLDNLTYFVFEK